MAKRKPEVFTSPTEQLHAARAEMELLKYIGDEADRLMLLEKELEADPRFTPPPDAAKKAQRIYSRASAHQTMIKSRKIAAVFLICLLVTGGALSLSVEAVRTELSQILYIVRERFVSLSGWGLLKGDRLATSSLKDLTPAYMPDGMIITDNDNLNDMITIRYEGEADPSLFVDYSVTMPGAGTLYDNENAEQATIYIGALTIRQIKKGGVVSLLWNDKGGYQFTLAGNIPEESLLRMAQSVPIE